MKNFLFAFDFKMGTMNEYILDFLKDNQIDYFYQCPGVLVADLFGTDEYYKLEIEDVIKDRKEVYYCTDKKYSRDGLERRFPLKEKAIRIGKQPCYTVKVFLENNDTSTTKINACKQKVFNFYMNNIFNMGVVEDNLQRVAWVEIIE